MEEIKRTLPIVAGGILLVAGTLFGASSAYGQTDTNSPQSAHANHSAGHEAHARVPDSSRRPQRSHRCPHPAPPPSRPAPRHLLSCLIYSASGSWRRTSRGSSHFRSARQPSSTGTDRSSAAMLPFARFYVEWFKSDRFSRSTHSRSSRPRNARRKHGDRSLGVRDRHPIRCERAPTAAGRASPETSATSFASN